MEKTKDIQEKVEQSTEQPPVEQKKKSKTLLYVVIGIFVFLVVIAVAAFLVTRGLIKKGLSVLEDGGEEFVEQLDKTSEDSNDEETEEDTFLYDKTTEEAIDGKLEKSNLITDNFPDDIPLPGGLVTSSSYDDYAVEVKIDINSTIEEIMDWYEDALIKKGWEITSKSSEQPYEGWETGSIKFAKETEEREGRLDLDRNPYQQVTTIRVREILW